MTTISIEGMEFFAYHGCFKEEQVIGTKFSIDLFMEVSTSIAEKSDKLEDTVNYQAVYLLVKKEMDSKSNLLEHVGRRVLESVLNLLHLKDKEFQRLGAGNLHLSPPSYRTSVCIVCSRGWVRLWTRLRSPLTTRV